MTFEETIAKSVELDRFLSGKEGPMPEVGGKSLTGGLRSMMEGVRKTAADVQAQLAAELQGMSEDIRANGALAIKKVRDERAETNAAFSDLLGNEMAGTGAEAPQEPKT